MKKYGIYLGLLFVIGSFSVVAGCAEGGGGLSHILQKKEKCALCGDEKNSLKSIYGGVKGIGLICLNDWQVVQVLSTDEEQLQCGGMSYMNNKEGDYSIQIEHVVERRVSLVDYTAGKHNRPDMKKMSEILCVECMQEVKEAVTIQGEHGNRKPKAVCMVEFSTMKLYSIQQNFQYYVFGDYYVQAECKKKKINLTVFHVSSGASADFQPYAAVCGSFALNEGGAADWVSPMRGKSAAEWGVGAA